MKRRRTSRKKAKRMLRREAHRNIGVKQKRFRIFVEHSIDAYFLHDDLGTVIDCNDSACRSLGYTRRELLGLKPPDFNPCLTPAEIERSIARLATGEILTLESRHRRKDGTTFPVEVRLRAFKSKRSRFFLAFVRDITERVQAEERAADLRNRLAHAQRYQSMGELASVIGHELSQPLSAVGLNVGLAKSSADKCGDPAITQCLLEIEQQTIRAGEIIRRTQAFIHRGPSQRQPCQIRQLIAEVLALLTKYLQQHATSVAVIAEDVTPPITADGIQIQQVLVNLIRNAVEAPAFADGERRTIFVRVESPADLIHVSVSDNGRGLDPAVSQNLFSPFNTSKPTGMGLGLSICRTIIEAHGGRLRYRPNLPHGADFYFSLPTTPRSS